MNYYKLYYVFIFFITSTSFVTIIEPPIYDECSVLNFYAGVEQDDEVKVITVYGELEEVEIILMPTNIDVGKYKITITRKGDDLYKLEGTNYYIETMYCYEYSFFDDAILEVESNYRTIKGTVYFTE